MSLLIEEHCDWLAVSRSEETVKARRRMLQYADSHLPHGVDHAHTNEIVGLFRRHREWSQWTRNTYWRHLNRYYEWGVLVGRLTINPMSTLDMPPEGDRLPSPIETEELGRLIAVTETGKWRQPWRLAVLLGAYAGLRVSSIANLKRADITEERMRIRRGKGGKDGYVMTHPLVWDEVKDLPIGLGNVVRDALGRTVTGYQITNRGWYFFRAIGLPGMHMHQLRHWHATALLEAGADLVTVQECMLHSNIRSTVGYTRVVSGRRREAVRRLPVVGHEPGRDRLAPDADEAA